MTETKTRLGRRPIRPDRVRAIDGKGFAFVPNQFLQEGFFASLNVDELVLYFLLVVAGNRSGLSFYRYDSLCSLMGMSIERYVAARNQLIDKDLIAFDGSRFQVLSLPKQVPKAPRTLHTSDEFEQEDGATIRLLIEQSMREQTRP